MLTFGPRRPATAYVMRAGTLLKSRTVGALSATVNGGKFGKIVKLLDGTIWRLEAKHQARLGEIEKYYNEHNIPFLYVPPGKKVTREEIMQRTEAGKRAAVTEPPLKTPTPVVPQPVMAAASQLAAVDILRDRVRNWKKPTDYQHAIDPKSRAELQQLTAKRRSIGSSRRGLLAEMQRLKEDKPKGWKTRLTELRIESENAAITYAQAGRRIRQLLGAKHATHGGGLSAITTDTAAVIDQLPHADLGFNPNDKPMSYLLSLGWQEKGPKDSNKFSKKEFDALLHEYDRFIGRTVAGFVQKYMSALGVDEYKPGSTWGDKKRPRQYKQKFREWKAEAHAVLFDLASKYKPEGDPSESNNFALYAHTTLPYRLAKLIKNDVGADTGAHMFVSDMENMPTSGGRMITPAARIETPEQALHRRELEKESSKILADTLSPLETAVVMARLNFGGDRHGTFKQKKGHSLTVGMNVLGWKRVRENVVTNLAKFIKDDAAKREALESVKRMKDSALSRVFDGAMLRLRAHANDLDNTQKRTLAELAETKRLYLEGIRHETWEGDEGFSKLIVKRPTTEKRAPKRQRVIQLGRTSKGFVKKSLVILDCVVALDGLIAECRLLDMNNGVFH